jgi:glycosyltransferase involved in cell wall biosynthesis
MEPEKSTPRGEMIGMSIKVSVIIPVYNGDRYLRDAIDSVVNQTYRNIEIIVVNDGSNDDGKSRAIAKQYGSRIRYIEQKNKGVAGALNTGLAAMSGDVFCWLSHDDVYRPNKIERQVDFFNRLGRDDVILFANYGLIDETGKVTGESMMERVIGDSLAPSRSSCPGSLAHHRRERRFDNV